MTLTRTSPLTLTLVLVLSACASTAAAETSTRSCVEASERGQAARDQRKLRDARRAFIACASSTCPNPLRTDCARWVDEVDAATPSIVCAAKAARGNDVFDARVEIDGEVSNDCGAGGQVAVDPGQHHVRFTRSGAPPVEVRVMVRPGERNRIVVGSFTEPAKPAPPPAPELERRPFLPTASWVLGGVAVVGLASFATLAFVGSSERTDLGRTCAPRCTDAEVSTLRAEYIGADISLAVGVVALGVATFIAFTQGDHRLARTIWK